MRYLEGTPVGDGEDFFKKLYKMKTTTFFAALLMANLSYGQVVQPSAPDTLILRSGEIAEVEIVDREKGDIKYYKLGDEENLRRTPVRMFKEIIEHSFAEQEFARNEEGEIAYGEVVQVEGLSKENIFNLTKSYLADEYNDVDEAIELEDKDLGMILVEGWFPVTVYSFNVYGTYKVWHSLKIEMKEGRYRYQIYNLKLQYKLEPKVSAETMFADESNLDKVQLQTKDKLLKNIAALTASIKKGIAVSSDDKW